MCELTDIGIAVSLRLLLDFVVSPTPLFVTTISRTITMQQNRALVYSLDCGLPHTVEGTCDR